MAFWAREISVKFENIVQKRITDAQKKCVLEKLGGLYMTGMMGACMPNCISKLGKVFLHVLLSDMVD